MLLDTARDHLGVFVQSNRARDENKSICFDGVREDVWERVRDFGGDDCFSLGHCVV